MLREMSYTSLPQDESSASERSSFMTHGLIEYPHRSSAGSNQKIVCFVFSFLLVTGATLAIVVPLMLDGPKVSSSDGRDSSVPISSPLNQTNGVESVHNGTFSEVVIDSSDHQIQSNHTTHIEEVTVNPNNDKTWKVVNTGDHIYIVPVYNNTQTNNTQINNTQLNNTHSTYYNDYRTPDEGSFEIMTNMTVVNNSSLPNNTMLNGTFIVNGTESSNSSVEAAQNGTRLDVVPTTQPVAIAMNAVQVEVTNKPLQEQIINPKNATQTDHMAPEQPLDHSGSPWEPYTNTSYINKASVMSSLDNTTLVVLVALIVVSLSSLVAAVAFLIHVKIETKRRRQNIANVIHDLQSPDKIILLNSDESENSEESDDEYRRH